jgi:sulfite exporter TauE/SafE
MDYFVLSSLILGLGGSLHCLGMCGPLIIAMPFSRYKGIEKVMASILFFLSKAGGYALMGIAVAILGKGMRLWMWQQSISIVAGISILIIAFFPFIKNKLFGGLVFPSFLQNGYRYFVAQQSMMQFIVLGFINALLPCGLVYTALLASVAFEQTALSAIYMFLFGIGTSFSLMTLIFVKDKMSPKISARLQQVSTYVSILIGVLLILRGLNLGIPYLSPQMQQDEVKSCCHRQE